MMSRIGGYSVAQLESMMRQGQRALIQQITTLRREIAERERRLSAATARLDELDSAELLLRG